jgi:hypothetical protein
MKLVRLAGNCADGKVSTEPPIDLVGDYPGRLSRLELTGQEMLSILPTIGKAGGHYRQPLRHFA